MIQPFYFLKKAKGFYSFLSDDEKNNLPVTIIFHRSIFNKRALFIGFYLTVKTIDIFRHHSSLIK